MDPNGPLNVSYGRPWALASGSCGPAAVASVQWDVSTQCWINWNPPIGFHSTHILSGKEAQAIGYRSGEMRCVFSFLPPFLFQTCLKGLERPFHHPRHRMKRCLSFSIISFSFFTLHPEHLTWQLNVMAWLRDHAVHIVFTLKNQINPLWLVWSPHINIVIFSSFSITCHCSYLFFFYWCSKLEKVT